MSALRRGHSSDRLTAQARSATKHSVNRLLPILSRGSSAASAGALPRAFSRRFRSAGSRRVKTTSASNSRTEGRSSQAKSYRAMESQR